MPELKFTSVFDKNLLAYNNGCKLIINQGGTRSSKTWSILQLLFLIAIYSKKPKIISVVSHALPHLKLGAMRDFDHILLDYGLIPDNLKNKTDNFYTINKCVIEFFGTDSMDKVHGPTRDILFVNEANFIRYDVYDQLAIRTKDCKIIDFNPTQSFWCHEHIMPIFNHTFIKSTYLDNEYLTSEQINQIETKKGIEKYNNWWNVYGLGELGKFEGVILSDWKYGEFDNSIPHGYGMDFGFNDPDVLVKVAIDHKAKKIYCDEKIYKSGNSSGQLKELVASNVNRNELIIADCADARMISELSRFFNIKPVDKSKWTVAEALKMMQDYEIVITENSVNLAKELNNYLWSDKKAGIPMSGYDHCIDSVRYWFQNSFKSTGIQTWRA